MRVSLLLPALAVLIALLTPPTRADRIVLQNGNTIEGDVTADDGLTLTLMISTTSSALVWQRTINKSQIRTWYRSPRRGASYVLIPIIGEIGKDVTADALRAGLAQARAVHPDYVVLAINSPGGDIGEMSAMVELLGDASKHSKVIAYVKSAYSAAAVIAISCRQIYMRPHAAIGAVVPFRMMENIPADVDAKFRSAFEAEIRAINANGEHADLLIRGMSELGLEIYLTSVNGKPKLSTSGPGKLIKAKGQILSMTADEAAECGLARVTTGIDDLGRQVAGGPWYDASRTPWNVTLGTVASKRQIIKEQAEQRQRELRRRSVIAAITPEWNANEKRMTTLVANIKAANDAIASLDSAADKEIRKINADYRQDLELAEYQTDPNAAMTLAKEAADTKASAVRQDLQTNVTKYQAAIDSAETEISLLHRRQQELRDMIPSD